eukprot:TRINITY_DN18700_c0_g1_i1.p1 TRINITY_DN18700_c0_g1~~TRINITY_DN18700_c0_g1_i1.p1  ORF type:complete len:1868 (+),score=606.29 TRINITY_DN18700_c0_g1_i1:60-5606(+)
MQQASALEAAVIALRRSPQVQRQSPSDVSTRVVALRAVGAAADNSSFSECGRVVAVVEGWVADALNHGVTRMEAAAAGSALCSVWSWLDHSYLTAGHKSFTAVMRDGGAKSRAVLTGSVVVLGCIHDAVVSRGLRMTQVSNTVASEYVSAAPNLERLPDSVVAREAVASTLAKALVAASSDSPAIGSRPVLEDARVVRQVNRACRDPSPLVRVQGLRAAAAAGGSCDAQGDQAWAWEQLLNTSLKALDDSEEQCRSAAADACAEILWASVAQMRLRKGEGSPQAAGAPASTVAAVGGAALGLFSLSRVGEALGVRRRRVVKDVYDAVGLIRDAFRQSSKEETQRAAAHACARLLLLCARKGTSCVPAPVREDAGEDGHAADSPVPDAVHAITTLCSLLDGVPAPSASAPTLWGDGAAQSAAGAAAAAAPPPAITALAIPSGVRAAASGLLHWAENCVNAQQRQKLVLEMAAVAALRSTAPISVQAVAAHTTAPPPTPVAVVCLVAIAPVVRAGLADGADLYSVASSVVTAACGPYCEWQLGAPIAGAAVAALSAQSASLRDSVARELCTLVCQDLAGNAWLGVGTPCDRVAMQRTVGAAQALCGCAGARAEPLPADALQPLSELCGSVIGPPQPVGELPTVKPKPVEAPAPGQAPAQPPNPALRLRGNCLLQAALAAGSPSHSASLSQLADGLGCLIRPPDINAAEKPASKQQAAASAHGCVVSTTHGLHAVAYALRAAHSRDCGAGLDPACAEKFVSAMDCMIENLLWSTGLPTCDEVLEGALARARAACTEVAALLARLQTRGRAQRTSTWHEATKVCVAGLAVSGWAAATMVGPECAGPADWHHLAPCPGQPADDPVTVGAHLHRSLIDSLAILFKQRTGTNQRALMQRLWSLADDREMGGVVQEQNIVLAVAECLATAAELDDQTLREAGALAEQALCSKVAATRRVAAVLMGRVAELSGSAAMEADCRLARLAAQTTVPPAAAAAAFAEVLTRDPARRKDTGALTATLLQTILDRSRDDDAETAVEVLRAVAAGCEAAGDTHALVSTAVTAVARGRAGHAAAAAGGARVAAAAGCGGPMPAALLDECVHHADQEAKAVGWRAAVRLAQEGRPLTSTTTCQALLSEVAWGAAAEPPLPPEHIAALAAVARAACADPSAVASTLSPQALLRLIDAAAGAGSVAEGDAIAAARAVLDDCSGSEEGRARAEEWLDVTCSFAVLTDRDDASRRRQSFAPRPAGKVAALGLLTELVRAMGAAGSAAAVLTARRSARFELVVRTAAAAAGESDSRVAAAGLRVATALVSAAAAVADPQHDSSCDDPSADPLLRQGSVAAVAAVSLASAARLALACSAPEDAAAGAAELAGELVRQCVLTPGTAERLFTALLEAVTGRADGAARTAALISSCKVVAAARAWQRDREGQRWRALEAEGRSLPLSVLRRISGAGDRSGEAASWHLIGELAAVEARRFAAACVDSIPDREERRRARAGLACIVTAIASQHADLAAGCCAVLLQPGAALQEGTWAAVDALLSSAPQPPLDSAASLAAALATVARSEQSPTEDRTRAAAALARLLRLPVATPEMAGDGVAAALAVLKLPTGAAAGLSALHAAAGISGCRSVWELYVREVAALLPSPEACAAAAAVPAREEAAAAAISDSVLAAAEGADCDTPDFWKAVLRVLATVAPASPATPRLRYRLYRACAASAAAREGVLAAVQAGGPECADVAVPAAAAAVSSTTAAAGVDLLSAALPRAQHPPAILAGVSALSVAAAQQWEAGRVRAKLLLLAKESAGVLRSAVAAMPAAGQQQLRRQLELAARDSAAAAAAARSTTSERLGTISASAFS